jgi:ATP-dependent helicase/nuclease subunit B
MLSKKELFARLAEGHAARITVVTPNRRLAQALVGEFDAFQAGHGLSVWEAPDILPLSSFIERLYEEALYADANAELPLLLTSAQEEWLWQEAVRSASRDLLVIDKTAAQCRDAWRLQHAWRLGRGQGNEDALAYAQWSELYQRKTAAHVDAARLPDLALSFL